MLILYRWSMYYCESTSVLCYRSLNRVERIPHLHTRKKDLPEISLISFASQKCYTYLEGTFKFSLPQKNSAYNFIDSSLQETLQSETIAAEIQFSASVS